MLVLAPPAFAAKDPIYTSLFSKNAAGGYDVTAYFSENKPVKGKKKFNTSYMGANWLFASQENLDLFLADPEKYAPQYGGYCAWAAAGGYTAKGDPKQVEPARRQALPELRRGHQEAVAGRQGEPDRGRRTRTGLRCWTTDSSTTPGPRRREPEPPARVVCTATRRKILNLPPVFRRWGFG